MWELAKILVWLVVPFFVASLIARLLRLPQFTRRIAIVVYALAIALAGLFPLAGAMKLGIDLSGGTILVYQVEQPAPAGFRIEKMVAALNRRINPAGITDVTIRPIGNDRVEITIPHASAEDVQRYKQILTSVGSLEFRILANKHDNADLIAKADASFPNPVVEGNTTEARWVPIAPSAQAEFSPGGEIAVRPDPQGRLRVLVVNDPYNVTGDFLQRAESTIDSSGRPAVGFQFNAEGARRFGQLTGENLPTPGGFERRLAILLNGEVYSAPAIRERISDNGIITGHFTRQEVDDLVSVLNAGSLPAALIKTPISESTVGPTLGQDTIRSGLLAIAISTIAVLIFMASYYWVAGLIADVAVLLNVFLVVGIMAWLHGTWTLAGLAGLALTVGMAVDTNVLIYERLREEQERTSRLSQAIEQGFRRAFSAIFDAHVTAILAGGVLYVIGSEQVKGFALTLVLGLAVNLFTAVFVCRLLFDVLERRQLVKRFRMGTLLSRPNYDFVGKRLVAVAGSSALILIGLVAVGLRGRDLLDIDFTGGSMAAIRLERPTSTATVRSLADRILPDATVEEVQIHGEPPGHRFLIRTTEQNLDRVKSQITREFGTLLTHIQMTAGPIEPIPPVSSPSSANPKEKPPSTGQPSGSVAAVPQAKNPYKYRVELTFNQPVTAILIRSQFERALDSHDVHHPESRFAVTGIGTPVAGSDEYRQFRLETDLDRNVLQPSLASVQTSLAAQTTFDQLENFGGAIIGSTQKAAGIAILASIVVIAGYLWIRFQNVLFGLATVVALVHDVLVVLGLVAMSSWVAGTGFGHALGIDPFKINLPIIAAFLTLVGYSVNDTIVVFDRIREVQGRVKTLSWDLINSAVNQTLSRTILTSFTTWLVSLILYAVGGAAIHGMAFCLVTGVIVGTYSSIYIGSPMLIWFGRHTATPAKVAKRPAGGDPSRPVEGGDRR